MKTLRLGVLASGRGTNLQAILDAVKSGELRAEVVCVVCNHRGAGAAARAAGASVQVLMAPLDEYASRVEQQEAIAAELERAGVDLVVCAGWDRVLEPRFVKRFVGRIINIHPSLLPSFGGGLHAIEDAFRYGVKVTGCTVHFVTEQVDEGPVIAQSAVEVNENDTLDTLSERIHAAEHQLLVHAISLYGDNRLKLEGRTVRIQPEITEEKLAAHH